MKRGVVKWYNEEKGYGMISVKGSEDVFVHFSEIKTDSSYKKLLEGDKVEFEVEQRDKGPAAKNVVKINKSGCYIATCVYGSYDCPEVCTLRRFRDDTLTKYWSGRKLISFYYTTSPMIVKMFGKKKWFQNFWKPILNIIVNILQNK